MIRKGILVDLTNFTISKIADYDDKRIDGMYVKMAGELYPAAYVFPVENIELVKEQLARLLLAKKAYDDLTAEVYYKVFPKLRDMNTVIK